MSNTLPSFLIPIPERYVPEWPAPTIASKGWVIVKIGRRFYPMSDYEYWEHVEGQREHTIVRAVQVDLDGVARDVEPAEVVR